MAKLGLIAGAGGLPVEIVRACEAAERPIFVVRLGGLADPAIAEARGVDAGVAEWGKVFAALKKEGCEQVCFAGHVPRPDFANLKPDMRGLAALPGIIAAARKGDDALLRQIMHEIEREGFVVEGANEVLSSLTISAGVLGKHAPSERHAADIEKAIRAARALGELDIGQGVVVANGLVLAVEAQEGTDAMLRRCAELPAALRANAGELVGVLAKAVKPNQDRRIDLPAIGPATVMGAARAGLAGIVGEAGSLLVIDRAAVIQTADDLGLFVVGVAPA
jgi:UDP-2,3-diacylglucosamine hydrolase